ncbi:MAG: ABC transporter ATP-binding protein [Fodinibius sp.]|nr:ABC transporter ATP-binding protein [Fodinibius sp.]
MISLKIENLAKSYGPNTVFSGISFDYQGKSLAIAGSNGTGKSTFLKCVGNLLRPSRGNIAWLYDGQPLNRSQLRRHMGYAAPYINLYDELSCRENLQFLAQIRHDSDAAKNIHPSIAKVGLDHVADQPFGTLSTGQQQRLRLASALFHQPHILLLDEPGSNLDEAGRALIADIAATFSSEEKLLIIASNNPDELAHCQRVFSIEQESFA